MSSRKAYKLLESLDDNIDNLEQALAPILSSNLTEITSKLPVLERAKLNVLVTYALESLIFCTQSHELLLGMKQ